MEPALAPQLTKDQHVLLGELVEILGMTDGMMITTVHHFNPQAAAAMRGAFIPTFIRTWARAVRGSTVDADLLKLVVFVEKKMKEIADARNDFIHGLFVGDYVSAGYVNPGYQTTSAVAFRSGERRQTNELPDLRERAALVSCVVAHIDHCIKSNDPSRWLDRVKPLLA